MEQLTIGAILNVVNYLKENGMTLKEIKELPIYLGNDDECNGIHTAWYAEPIDPADEEYKWAIELIEEDYCNVAIKGKAILIS